MSPDGEASDCERVWDTRGDRCIRTSRSKAFKQEEAQAAKASEGTGRLDGVRELSALHSGTCGDSVFERAMLNRYGNDAINQLNMLAKAGLDKSDVKAEVTMAILNNLSGLLPKLLQKQTTKSWSR